MLFPIVGAFVFAYLLGSIPFGLILTRAAGLGDIRTIGSGNIGATNVLRTGNKKLAALTLFLDALKGLLAVAIIGAFMPRLDQVAALGAVLGHMFPIWLSFKGGKGVATGIGAIMGLSGLAGFIVLVLWLPIVFFLRISSLATLIVALLLPPVLYLVGDVQYVPVSIVIIALIFYKHRENIRRLLNHTEPRIELHKNGTPPPQ